MAAVITARRFSVYVNECARHSSGMALWVWILTFLLENEIPGATVFRAVAGFGEHRLLHSSLSPRSEDGAPIKIEFVDAEEHVNAVIEAVAELLTDGFINVDSTLIVKKGIQRPPSHRVT
jgi:uncharacterized protein